jgi:hypothetical protein
MGDPVAVLIEDPDPVRRAQAHTTLGERALERDAVDLATEHLLEAIDLDPTDEAPRRLLEAVAARTTTRRKRWWPFR